MTAPPSARFSPLMGDDVHAFDAFVVPRYMTLFGEPVLEMIAESREAQVIHVHCRTGYPDRALATRLWGARIYSCDASPWALAAARTKVTDRENVSVDYRAMDTLPLPFPQSAFSHAVSLHPPAVPNERHALISEFARLLAPRGQMLVSMPLRGSFVEVSDLLREFAVKNERVDVMRSVEVLVEERPTGEMLATEVEKAGFDFVDVDVRARTLKFETGREFIAHPVARLFALREFRATHSPAEWTEMVDYVAHAIDKYWSGHPFELTVKVGCVTGRRKTN